MWLSTSEYQLERVKKPGTWCLLSALQSDLSLQRSSLRFPARPAPCTEGELSPPSTPAARVLTTSGAPGLGSGLGGFPQPASAGRPSSELRGVTGHECARGHLIPFQICTLSNKVETTETTDGAGGGHQKQTFVASESAFLAGIPSPRRGEPDAPKAPSPQDERPCEEPWPRGSTRRTPAPRTPPPPRPPPGLPPTLGARRARGPERRPASVRAMRPPGPAGPSPRQGRSGRDGPGGSAAARGFRIVRDQGAARSPDPAPGPALPRPRSPAAGGAARAGLRAPGAAGTRSRGPRGTGAGPPGPREGGARTGPAEGPWGAGRLRARLAAAAAAARSAPSGRARVAFARARGRELGASRRGPERVAPPSVHAPERPAPAPPPPLTPAPKPPPRLQTPRARPPLPPRWRTARPPPPGNPRPGAYSVSVITRQSAHPDPGA